MDEEQLKFLVELVNKVDAKIEDKIASLEKKISELESNLENKKEENFTLLKKELDNINEDVKTIKEKVKILDPEIFKKFEEVLENLKDLENKIIASLEKLEKLETEIPSLFYHLKDLTDYEEKLNELIEKIQRWDKIFDLSEIEYYEERINLIKNWVEEQLKKGYSLDEVREELIKNGYSTFFIHKVLKDFEKEKK